MKFSLTSRKKLTYLIIGIVLNVFSCLCSLSLKSSVDKLNLAPFSFLWEFLTINWCVWNSAITCIYNISEIKNESQKVKITEKKERDFGFLVAISNLIVMLVFTTYIIIDPRITNGKGWFWFTYSAIWHYVAPIISLTYFFRFVKIKKTDLNKKNLLAVILPMPIIFFLANMIRRILISEDYLEMVGLKKFLVHPFEWIEKGKLIYFAFFAVFALLAFWLFIYLLLKLKKKYFPWTVVKVNKKNKRKFLGNLITNKDH